MHELFLLPDSEDDVNDLGGVHELVLASDDLLASKLDFPDRISSKFELDSSLASVLNVLCDDYDIPDLHDIVPDLVVDDDSNVLLSIPEDDDEDMEISFLDAEDNSISAMLAHFLKSRV